MTIRAVFENGVFRPTEKVEFPDPCEVEIDVRQVKQAPSVSTTPPPKASMSEGLTKIYEILGERYDSGFTDIAERHDEHQPRHDGPIEVNSAPSPR